VVALVRSIRRVDLVALGIVAALLVTVAFGSFAWRQQTGAAQALETLGSEHLRVSTAAGDIRWYDEVLTHSASRYVLSQGDPVWRARYDRFVERLDGALAYAAEHGEPDALARLAEVDVANDRLVALETRVFALVDEGRSRTASGILAGEYEHQKAAYRKGLEAFVEIQSERFGALIAQERSAALRQRTLNALAALLMLVVLVGLGVRYRSQHRQLVVRDRERSSEAAGREFDRRLSETLEMALAEDDVFDALGGLLRAETPARPSELLLADSSRAHLRRVLRTDPTAELPSCGVDAPYSCPAIRRGQTLQFASSERYDVCPNLQGRPSPCSAVCVPLSLDGLAVGVVHSIGPVDEPIGAVERRVLEEVARRAGERVGLLRAFSRSEHQARTDALTGLLNRRSASDALAALLQSRADLAVALVDLDHFKALNDTHGHDAGDRALRLFARILREEARPDDIVARWGGEEFLVALDGADAVQAKAVLERVQALLSSALDRGGVAGFTASAGVVDTSHGYDLERLVALADRALYAAKDAGRDRIEVASEYGAPLAASPTEGR
jgi:diguanylate cyclase (GGDEF)-like protein